MAGIYQRDNINYGGMLGNAMRERANYLANKRAQEVQNAQNWGNAIQQSGKILNDAVQKYAYTKWGYDQDMNKLAVQQQFQAEQNAFNKEQELQRAREQQIWQSAENALQRSSNEKIAADNRKNTVDERSAQNVMNYNNAVTQQQYAEQALNNAKPGTPEWAMAQRDLQYAKNKVAYYGGLIDPQLRMPSMPAGTKEDPIVVSGPEAEAALMNENFTTEEPETEWERKERITRFETLEKTPKSQYTNAIKAKLLEEAKGDEALITRVNNLGKTVEERKASAAATLKRADAEYQKLDDMSKDIYLDQHKQFRVVNGHLSWK